MKATAVIILALLLAGCAAQVTQKEKKRRGTRMTPDVTQGTMGEPNGKTLERIDIFQRTIPSR